jgi:hypothetical protein
MYEISYIYPFVEFGTTKVWKLCPIGLAFLSPIQATTK